MENILQVIFSDIIYRQKLCNLISLTETCPTYTKSPFLDKVYSPASRLANIRTNDARDDRHIYPTLDSVG